ncbi:peptide ABC transporter substrate-binding protein [Candidatus Saccharibacteria bacterium]|nr:peptide ABC transporter substrate-binding protein [Candidatus Saccharibacteria bacterium]
MDEKSGWKKFELKKRSRKIKTHARRLEKATTKHAHRFLVKKWDKIQEVRLHIFFWLAGVGILIAIVGVQMIWFQKSYVTTASVPGGTYAEAIKGPVQSLNPLFAKSPAELSASRLLFSSLYSFDSSGHLRGDLATAIRDEGDKVFTVKLRNDARWHDGKPVTADDVVFTVDLMRNSSTHAVMYSSWQRIVADKVDKNTVKFTLPATYAAFQQALTFGVLPKHILKDVKPSTLQESSYSTNPIGSGPFKLRLLQVVSETTDRKIVHMDANTDYYAGRPKLDKFLLQVYRDSDSIERALITGEVNGASDLNSEVASRLHTDRYNIVTKPVNSGVYAIFNNMQETLKDVKVRKALREATNTAEIREKIYGNPPELYLPFVARLVPSSGDYVAPDWNTLHAAMELDEAGYKIKNGVRMDKNGQELKLRLVTRKNSDFENVAKMLASQWRRVGVQVDVRVIDTNDPTQNYSTDIVKQHNYDVLVDEMVMGGDPDVYTYWHTKGNLNLAGYSSELSDDDLASARTTSDEVLRNAKYLAFAKHWIADAPAIGLYQSVFVYAHTKSTRTIEPDEVIVSPDKHYSNVLYWTSNKGSVYKTP